MSGMPRFVYEEEHEMFRTSVRKFLETEAAPYHAQWEKDGHVDRQLWIKAGEQGFLSPTVGEEYGGVGADFRYNAIVDEEIGRSGLTGIGWVCTLISRFPTSCATAMRPRKRSTCPSV